MKGRNRRHEHISRGTLPGLGSQDLLPCEGVFKLGEGEGRWAGIAFEAGKVLRAKAL